MGTCSRQGLGKLRHLDTHTLWVQQAVRSRRIQLLKIAGEVNPADVFTKHSLSRDRLMKLTKLFDCKYMSGRAASAPQMRSTSGTRVTMAEANAVEEEDHSQGEKDPEMPHRVLARDALERLHPPVVAPHDLHQEPDLHDDDCDGIIVEGERMAKEIMEEAKKEYKPEFLNRLDDLVVFKMLEKDSLSVIVDLEIEKLLVRLREKEIEMDLDGSARDFLITEGYDPNFGARPMRRAVERHLEDPLAEALLRAEFKAGDLVSVSHEKDAKELSFESKPSKPEPDEAEVTG